jgi:hypothetical protein
LVKANKKGFVYAIKGETNDIILLAYKINKSINNNTIKARTQELLIQGDSSALKVQIFGVVQMIYASLLFLNFC